MKFGVMLPHFKDGVASTDLIRRMAIETDELGYDSIWAVDHIVVPHPSQWYDTYGGTFYETFTTLGFVASITKRVRLGTSVIVVPYRHPLLLAKLYSTLDQLSGGRVIAGVGVGSFEMEYRSLQIPFERRGAMANEALKIMKYAWTEEGDLNHEGQFWQFHDTNFLPRPVQKPHPPIYVGGRSKFAVRRVVEHGEAFNPTISTPDAVKEVLDQLHAECERRGRDPDTLKLFINLGIKVTDVLYESPDCIGTVDQISRRLDALQRAGVDSIMLRPFTDIPELGKETEETALKSIDTFANKVMPRFQG